MKWSAQEDQILLRQCRAQQRDRADGLIKDWNAVANALPNRNNKDCRKRWYNVVSGETRKGCWSPEEDEQLITAVSLVGTSWAAVAEKIGNRSADQCAKRWQQNLNPELDHGKWTKRECQILVDAVQTNGRKWLKIRDQHFPKRATNNIKNQYYILTKDQNGPDRQIPKQSESDDSTSLDDSEEDCSSLPSTRKTSLMTNCDIDDLSMDIDDKFMTFDATHSSALPQTHNNFDNMSPSLDFFSGASTVSNMGNVMLSPWPGIQHVDPKLMTCNSGDITHSQTAPALENRSIGHDFTADFNPHTSSSGFTPFDWPPKQSDSVAPGWNSTTPAFEKDSNMFPACQSPLEKLDPLKAVDKLDACADADSYVAKIFIRRPSPTIIGDIMTLVMTHEGQAWVELERP